MGTGYTWPVNGYSLDLSPETYRQLLVEAARDCDVDTYFMLLQQGVDPLRRCEMPPRDESYYCDYDFDYHDGSYDPFQATHEDSLLFIAAKSGCADIVEHLLLLGEDVSFRGSGWMNPLSVWASSSQSNHPKCHWERTGWLLLDAGADPAADHGMAWKQAAKMADGHAKRVLIAWQAGQQFDALDRATVVAVGSGEERRRL